MNLLVVDWDYFFPVVEHQDNADDQRWQLYDWGHSENQPIFFDYIWVGRAAAFKQAGIDIPRTSGLERSFWERFTFSKNAQLLYADSNSQAYHERVSRHVGSGNQVWLFDAHHDSGYRGTLNDVIERGSVSCEDWTIPYYLEDADVHVRYPSWRTSAFELEPEPIVEVERKFDDGERVPDVFHRVFVCRSSAWTPPWVDDDFQTFIDSAPLKRKVDLAGNLTPRRWDWGEVDRYVEEFKSLKLGQTG